MSFAKSLMEYYRNLDAPDKLPKEIEVMNPYQSKETFQLASTFYHKYYDDQNERIICFGINPGRFGAGLTGVPFTDPIRLEEDCGIPNNFDKKPELSTRFIYEMINAYGGPEKFYSKFYISGVSPLGYLKEGININYYDLKGYKKLFEKYAVEQIEKQLTLNISTKTAFSIGKGKNIEFLNWINKKYYDDQNERIICFGINPGRFGAGLTGVPFTDPIRLEEDCGIPNDFDKKPELSTRFIYEMIHAYGGPRKFYSKFYISGVSPLGYLKDGININYYDLKGYKKLFEKYAVTQIEEQLKLNINTSVAFSIGKGKNIEFLNWINKKYSFFDEILPLPHPRWVMQYRLKRKAEFIEEYIRELRNA